ncbi:uncharacterized protein LOC143511022 [Brachyhypopomus gauderio]|uniref:uncharacterized protein LOC143511022 n=1 Tax=Brachyhypopomus gauderio TaxID=698409 RepID=UPI00404226EF
MGSPLLLCVAVLLFACGVAQGYQPGRGAHRRPPGRGAHRHQPDGVAQRRLPGPIVVDNPFAYDGGSDPIELDQPFVYAGRSYSKLYLDMNGFVSFFPPADELYPDANVAKDGIFPLWADIESNEGGDVWYYQGSNSSVTSLATEFIHQSLREYNSTVTWVFFASWFHTPLELESENVSFQVALVNDDDGNSYVIMLYYGIPPIQKYNWLAGFAVENNTNFMELPVQDSIDLSLTSNIGCPGLWFFSVQNEPNVIFFPIGPEAHGGNFPYDGASVLIDLDFPFTYNGRNHSQFYLNMNGFVTFSNPSDELYPNAHIGMDMIAPFWADIENDEGGEVYYEQATDGPLIEVATDAVNLAFQDADFEEAAWVFVATWLNTPLENENALVVSFQVVLISDKYGRSFVLMNYKNFPDLQSFWLAGFAFNDIDDFDRLQVNVSSDLSLGSNVGFPGRWAFQVSFQDICEVLQCVEGEVCKERTGIYGCACSEDNPRTNPDTFDAIETCSGSSGTVSLSRCQLFEAGFTAESLSLQDNSCSGVEEGDRVTFQFDDDDNSCGTVLWNNKTHLVYENHIVEKSESGDKSVISRDSWMSFEFSCVYPLIESITMPMSIKAGPSVIYKDLKTDGSYQIIMVPYPDASFNTPYSGDVIIDVNQQIFVGVDVVGFDSDDIAVVLDRCWATPVNDMDYYVYWDLINNECPNVEDGTVQVLQNGVSMSGRFAFRMFTFTNKSPTIFLHCNVHLCLVEDGDCRPSCEYSDRRRRRSLDFHDKASISMSF